MSVHQKHIETGYHPRSHQQYIHQRLKRFNVLICHRRFGKTHLVVNEIIDQALRCVKKNPQYAYIAPTYGQAKRISWDIIKEYTRMIPGIEYHEGELRITIPRPWLGDQIKILLLGGETPDSIRGIYLDGVILDEYAECDPRVWTQVVRAALTDRIGWAVFIGTPKGMNHLFDVLEVAKRNPGGEWFYAIFKASETQIIAASELEQARAIMSEDEFNQEFECFPPGTLIATTRGQFPIEQLRNGDFVLTHKNRWRPVTDTNKRKYSGDLISILSYGSGKPMLCTPEHPFLVHDKTTQTNTWIKARDLKNTDCLVMPKIRRGPQIVSEHFVRILAWYICEGFTARVGTVTFCLNPNNIEEINRVKLLLLQLGYVAREYTKGNVVVTDTAFAGLLASLGGCLAENKRIPFDIISGHEEIFFQELMLGDGCVSTTQGGRRHVYVTVSRGLANDVALLAGSLGRRSGIVTKPSGPANIRGRDVLCAEKYTVQIPFGFTVNHSSIRQCFPAKNGIIFRIREIKTVPYTGNVHNISVKEDESYVAEGKSVHNCDFAAALVGAYYGKEMARAEKDNRITRVPYDKAVPVSTYWDLGIGDSTAIWFMQCVGRGEWHAIDYLEDSGKGLDYYAKELKQLDYYYERHVLPHDGRARSLETGRTRIETLENLGIKPVDVLERHPVEDGINAARVIMSKVWFDAQKCERGINALKNYQKKWDSKNKIYSNAPLHDWTSHGSDAFRAFAMGRVDRVGGVIIGQGNQSDLPRQAETDYDIFA